jgi:hypothetical protein
MATKDELVAYGQANGVAVDASMLKADIEQALRDAGYDPDTLQSTGGTAMTQEPAAAEAPAAPPEEERLSRDARDSTYAQVDPPDDVFPPPGPIVEQTLGTPKEASD